jgi:hypothetical protein
MVGVRRIAPCGDVPDITLFSLVFFIVVFNRIIKERKGNKKKKKKN